MIRLYQLIIAAFLLVTASVETYAQTNISGVINSYTQVTDIDYTDNYIVVSDTAGFYVGEKAILIQMNGASITSSNNSSFGTVTAYNDAGNYEICTVCEISGDTITFQHTLQNTYTTSDAVQLVSMPHYTNAAVSGAVCDVDPWDGTTGGVFAIEVENELELLNNIVAKGDGFLGADFTNSSYSCSWLSVQTDYYYDYTGGKGAKKGEGIADPPSGADGGRGPLANGGGGANDHNGGGGGGGNYGAGGQGGQRIPKTAFYCKCTAPGMGGKALTYSNANNRIFMGGGGGAGHGNNTVGTKGGNGGGIVIIRANILEGNNQKIRAEGNGTTISGSDGAGGGGAGGTVILEVDSFGTTDVRIWVDGGNGGKTNNGGGLEQCNGPGGGGGGGMIWTSLSSLHSSILEDLAGGTAGTTTATSQSNCTVGSSNSGTAGSTGGSVVDLSMPESNTVYGGCSALLPVEIIHFEGTYRYSRVDLEWTTATEVGNSHFVIERSSRGTDWTPIGQVQGAGNSFEVRAYAFSDHHPTTGINYYRLKQVDVEGAVTYAGIVAVAIRATNFEVNNIYPNPVEDHLHIPITSPHSSEVVFEMVDLLGRTVYQEQLMVSEGANDASLYVGMLEGGTYLLRIQSAHGTAVVRVVKQ